MGTRGHIIIRYRGRFFCIYNHYDSYWSCLGNAIFTTLRKIIEEGGLQGLLEILGKILLGEGSDSDEREVLDVLDFLPSDTFSEPSLEAVSHDPDLFIEFVYIVNFDAELFSMLQRNTDPIESPDFTIPFSFISLMADEFEPAKVRDITEMFGSSRRRMSTITPTITEWVSRNPRDFMDFSARQIIPQRIGAEEFAFGELYGKLDNAGQIALNQDYEGSWFSLESFDAAMLLNMPLMWIQAATWAYELKCVDKLPGSCVRTLFHFADITHESHRRMIACLSDPWAARGTDTEPTTHSEYGHPRLFPEKDLSCANVTGTMDPLLLFAKRPSAKAAIGAAIQRGLDVLEGGEVDSATIAVTNIHVVVGVRVETSNDGTLRVRVTEQLPLLPPSLSLARNVITEGFQFLVRSALAMGQGDAAALSSSLPLTLRDNEPADVVPNRLVSVDVDCAVFIANMGGEDVALKVGMSMESEHEALTLLIDVAGAPNLRSEAMTFHGNTTNLSYFTITPVGELIKPKIPFDEALSIVEDVRKVLYKVAIRLHCQHGDVKPTNILRVPGQEPSVLLIDYDKSKTAPKQFTPPRQHWCDNNDRGALVLVLHYYVTGELLNLEERNELFASIAESGMMDGHALPEWIVRPCE